MAVNRLTGTEIEDLKAKAAAHFFPHAAPAGDMSEDTGLKLVDKSQGVWVEDVEGDRWFDTMSGMWLKNIGHGRKEIRDAVYEQMSGISYSPGGTVAPATAELAAKLASLSPDPDSRIYFVSGGSEANETALKMAKKYHRNNGEPGRYKVISRMNSYHGATAACLSLGGGGNRPPFPTDYEPLVPGNIHVAQPAPYRCHLCGDSGECNLQCAYDVERAILHAGPHTVAAVIAEPISAAAGIHIPHPEYWPTLREITEKYGVLLIADEVITGFGRTGKMFAVEHWGVKPDIMTMAKALTSGYLPIGAAIANKKVSDSFLGAGENMFRALITFGGNPVSCAAGVANIKIMEEEGMVENSAEMGDYMYEKLQTLYEHEIVGDVRGGMGLLCAVELVKDRDTKESFPPEAGLIGKMAPLLRKNFLLGRAGDSIFLAPPLCITKDEVDLLVERVEAVISELEEAL